MFSYQHITSREEFIQQFRKDHGLGGVNKNALNKTMVLNSNKSRGNLLNKSVSQSNTRNGEGRWDYLYNLEKLRRLKLDEERKKKEMNEYERDLEACTFSPKLNIDKSLRQNSGMNSAISSALNNMSMTGQRSKINSNGNNSTPLSEGTSLIDRQKAWEYKKNMKIENIKQVQNIRDNAECVFSPKLNPPDKLKTIQIDQKANTLVCDPESFTNYIKRQNKHRSEIEYGHKREKSLPGSGNIWTNKPTKPKEFNLLTEANGLNRSLQRIKSLSKPVALNKFTNLKPNYKAGDGRNERNNKLNVSDLVYSPRNKKNFEDLEQKNQNGIKLENKIEFGYALKNLHDELHSIDLHGRQVINLDN